MPDPLGIPHAIVDVFSAPNTALDHRLDLGRVNWDAAVTIFMLQSNPGVGVGLISITDDLGVNLIPARDFDATHLNLIVALGALDGVGYVIQTSPTDGWSGGARSRGCGKGARKPQWLDFHIDALGVGLTSRLNVIAEDA